MGAGAASGDALITERGGALKLRRAAGELITVSGTPEVAYAGQGGLGDVIPASSYPQDQRIYLSWVEPGDDGTSGAVVGSGRLGGAVGSLFVKAGHPVLFASRHPEELKSLADPLGPLARTGTVAQALAFADVILLAVPYSAVPEVGQQHRWQGKIVLDATNAIAARDGAIVDEVKADAEVKKAEAERDSVERRNEVKEEIRGDH